MKYLALAILALACTAGAASAQVEMPRAFHGEWCRDGHTCPNGWMTVTKSGVVGTSGVRCDLKKALYQAQETDYRHYRGLWELTFKCTDSKTLVEERWFFVDEMLVVTFDLPTGGLRFVQYLPRIKRDQG